MSHDPAELDDLLAEWGGQEPPPLDRDQAEAMVTMALAALDDEDGTVAPAAVEPATAETAPEPANRRVFPLAFGLLALAAGAVMALTALQSMPTEQAPAPEVAVAPEPTSVPVPEVAPEAPAAPEFLEVRASPGLELAVRESQPVLLHIDGHQLRLMGTGHLKVTNITKPEVLVVSGVLQAHWKTTTRVPLRLHTSHGDVALEQGKGTIEVTASELQWTLEQGAAHRVDPSGGKDARTTEPVAKAEPAEASDGSAPEEGADTEIVEPELTAESLYAAAERAMAEGNRAKAIQLFQQHREQFPNDGDDHLVLFELAREVSKIDADKGAALYREYLETYPHGMLASEAERALGGR